jgi:hypothetical protein
VDRVDQLIEMFRSAGTASDAEAEPKVHAVVELEDLIGDARVVPFFVSVVADPDEHDLARIECLKILRLSPPGAAADRGVVGRTIAAALRPDEDYLVRQYAAGALGPYAADAAVFAALTDAVLGDEDIDVRHSALSSVEEAGKHDQTVSLLRRVAADDTLLGRAAARTLRSWTTDPAPGAAAP